MIELSLALLQIFIFILIFNYPINIHNNFKLFKLYKLGFYDSILINIIIHLNVYLCLSFFKINLHVIFGLQLIIGLLYFFYYQKEYFKFIKENILIFIFFLSTIFSLFVIIIWDPILTWDGISHWFFKAQIFYQNGEYKQLKEVPLNHYPHLGSYIWAYFWKNNFLQLEYFGRFFYVFIFVTTIFSSVEIIKKKFSDFEICLIILLLLTLTVDKFLLGGYQEYLIFAIFYLISKIFLLLSNKDNYQIKYFYLLFYTTSFLFLWIKQEGFFYYIISSIIFVIFFQKELKKKLISLLIVLFLLTFYLSIRIYFHESFQFNEQISSENLFNQLSLEIIISKFFFILKYILISFFKYPIWILIIFSLFFLYRQNYFRNKKYIIVFLIFNFLFITSIYLYSSYDLVWFLSTSLSRLLFGLSGFFILLIIESFNYMRRDKNFKD